MERYMTGKFWGFAAVVAIGFASAANAQILGDAYSYTGPGQGLIENFNGGLLDLGAGHVDITPSNTGFDDTVVAGTTVNGTKWSVETKNGEFATSLRNPYAPAYDGNTWAFTERGYVGGGDGELPAAASLTGTAADYPVGDVDYNLSIYGGSPSNAVQRLTARFSNDTGAALRSLALFFDVEVSHLREANSTPANGSWLGEVQLQVSTDNVSYTTVATYGDNNAKTDPSAGLVSYNTILAALGGTGSNTGGHWYTDAQMDALGLAKRGLGGAFDVSSLNIGAGDSFYVRWNIPQNTGQDTVQFGVDNITTVPEPASVALIGLGALAMFRRRRA